MIGGNGAGGDPMARQAWRVVAVLLLFAACGSASLAQGARFPKAGLPVQDTGIVVESNAGIAGLPIRWMDEDRIIFSALKPGAGPTSAHSAQTREILIYNTRTDEIKKYAAGKLSCYENGRIVYVTENIVWKDEASGAARFANRVKHGPMGEEVDEVVPVLGERSRDIGCSDAAVSRARSLPQYYNFTLLRPEHGYIDRGTSKRTELAVLVRPGKPSIELPFYGFEVHGDVDYAPWADTYVLNAGGATFQPYFRIDPSPKPVIRLLKPNGEVSELAPPNAFFKHFGKSGPIRLARAGMVYTGLELRAIPDKEQGLYLVNGQEAAQLLDGHVEDVAVSPDGCRIAVSSSRDWHPVKYSRTIKIVRLCGG